MPRENTYAEYGEAGLDRLERLMLDRPSDEALNVARRIIIRPPQVCALADGGIQLEFARSRILINSDGTIRY